MSVFACTAAWTISAAQSLPAEPVGAAPTPAMPVAEQGLAGPAAKAGVANPGAQIGVDRSVASPGDVPMPIDKRGNNALTAGPDPRVQFPADSRDHAAIFGTQDEDELALAGQERAVDEQRMRLQALERLFNQTPGPRAAPAGTIPLSRSSADQPPPSMPKLAPRRLAPGRHDGCATSGRCHAAQGGWHAAQRQYLEHAVALRAAFGAYPNSETQRSNCPEPGYSRPRSRLLQLSRARIPRARTSVGRSVKHAWICG